MASINEHLANLVQESTELAKHVRLARGEACCADEFTALEEVTNQINILGLALHEARKVFERTKDMDENDI